MEIGAALSTDPDPAKATAEAAEEARASLGGAEVSLAVLVASRHHGQSAEVVSEALRDAVRPERVIGCVAETVVGGPREVEDGPAVAVWLAGSPSRPRPSAWSSCRPRRVGCSAGTGSRRRARVPTC